MIPGEFRRKLKQLNSKLEIYCGKDDSKPATLFLVDRDEFTPICSVDKNWVPKYSIANESNKILKSGWQRTLRVLMHKKLIDKSHAEFIFGKLDNKKVKIYKTDEKIDRIEEMHQKKIYYGDVDHNGNPVFSKTELLDMKEELAMARRK